MSLEHLLSIYDSPINRNYYVEDRGRERGQFVCDVESCRGGPGGGGGICVVG